MLFWMLIMFVATIIGAIALKELFEYVFYSNGYGMKSVQFVVRLEDGCTSAENIVRTFQRYAEKLDTAEGAPKIVLITENADRETLNQLNILKKDYINLRVVNIKDPDFSQEYEY